MHFGFGIKRTAQTTLPCPNCQEQLSIERSCRSAQMHCSACNNTFPIEQFIAVADDVMESFLDGLYLDRI